MQLRITFGLVEVALFEIEDKATDELYALLRRLILNLMTLPHV